MPRAPPTGSSRSEARPFAIGSIRVSAVRHRENRAGGQRTVATNGTNITRVDVNRRFQDAFSSDSQRDLHSIVWEHDLTVFGLVQTSGEGRAKLPIRILDALSLTTARDHTLSARDLRMSGLAAGNCRNPNDSTTIP